MRDHHLLKRNQNRITRKSQLLPRVRGFRWKLLVLLILFIAEEFCCIVFFFFTNLVKTYDVIATNIVSSIGHAINTCIMCYDMLFTTGSNRFPNGIISLAAVCLATIRFPYSFRKPSFIHLHNLFWSSVAISFESDLRRERAMVIILYIEHHPVHVSLFPFVSLLERFWLILWQFLRWSEIVCSYRFILCLE